MSNHLATVSCDFENINGHFTAGSTIKGKFWVIPKKDLHYLYIRYSVILRIEAVHTSTKHERIVHSKKISNQPGEWKTAITSPYEYPFQFTLSSPLTYAGQYFRIKWFVQFETDMTTASKKALRKAAMEKLNLRKIIFPNTKINTRLPFVLNRGGRQLKALGKFYNIQIQHPVNKFWLPTTIGLVGIMFASLAKTNLPFYIFDIMGATSFSIGLYQTVIGVGTLGSLKFEITPNSTNTNTFNLQATIQKNWSKVEKIGVYYEVSETDHNGSSSKNLILFRPKLEIQKPVVNSLTTLQIPFPKKDLPPSIAYESYAIVWKLFISIYLNNGKKKTYHFTFNTQL